MAIRVYQEGEHPSGFIGIRVTRSFGGKYRQSYFSFRKNGGFISVKEQKALMQEAESLEEQWKQESQQARYESRLSAPHPNTKPFRSVGVEGITAEFAVDNSGPDRMYYYPGFRVSQPGVKSGAARHIRFSLHGYTGAWKLAVEMWAERYSILPKDKKRVLKNMPDPNQFVALRRQMNKEGHDIPTTALSSVFAEQRQAVASGKSAKPAAASRPAKAVATAAKKAVAVKALERHLQSEVQKFTRKKAAKR